MKVDNKQDALRKNAKRESMRVRCGGTKYFDVAGKETSKPKTKKTETEQVENNAN